MQAVFSKDLVVFDFKGLWNLPSKCGLRIFERGEQRVVVVSELYQDNPGTAVAQVSASLAMQICEAHHISYHLLVYIEHNPHMHSKLSFYDEECFLVQFDATESALSNPRWEKLSPEQLEHYTGLAR